MSNKLQQGLSILYDLELNDYMMARAISKLDGQINDLGRAKKINKPTKGSTKSGALYWTGVITTVSAVIGAILEAISSFKEAEGFLFKLFVAFGGAIVGAITGAIFGLIIGLIVSVFLKSSSVSSAERKFKTDCEIYEKDIEKDRHRVNNELAQRDFLIKQRDSLVKRRNEARSKLRKYYDLMGIDNKYRNLVPIGYMNEFARLGISRHLEGADGLYYLVRTELRYDQMNATLNDIAYNLDTIVDKQRELYDEVTSINRRCDEMINLTVQNAKNTERSLNRIEENTSITAYNTQRISQEIAFQNFMLYY